MTNIGSIVLSLPSSPGDSFVDRRTDGAIATQVQAISIANTLTRLIVGPLADFVSPVHIGLSNGVRQYSRKPWVSRKVFLTSAALVLFAAEIFWGTFIRSQKALLLLRSVGRYIDQSQHADSVPSICTGSAYGATFTIL